MRFAALAGLLALAVGMRDESLGDEALDTELEPASDAVLDMGLHRIEGLCSARLVDGASTILGGNCVDGLEEVLALRPHEVVLLLRKLELTDASTCRELCEAALRKIPPLLEEAVPYAPDESCLTSGCEVKVDVSPERLLQSGLTYPHASESDRVAAQKSVDALAVNVTHTPHSSDVRTILRRLLAVVFRMFPSVPLDSSSAGPELPTAMLNASSEDDPAFGERVREDRKQLYRQYNAMAYAWVSEAVRKLSSGRELVKTWFILKTDAQVDAQLKEARFHMTMMMDLFGSVKVAKGIPQEQGGACRASTTTGVMAYVLASTTCEVEEYRDCGEKESGKYVINFCDFFWHDAFDEAERAGTFVHEASHHFGTEDKGYCDAIDCLSLSPASARNNADTYAAFVKALVADRSLAKDSEPERPPCRDSELSGFVDNWNRRIPCSSVRSYPALSCTSGPHAKHLRAACPATCGACAEAEQSRSAPETVYRGSGGEEPKSAACFPPSALAQLALGDGASSARPIAELKYGDLLMAADGRASPFLLDVHAATPGRRGALLKYLRVQHERQTPGRPLLVTFNHFVFVDVDGRQELRPAGELRPGEHRLLAAAAGGGLAPSLVTAVDEVVLPGFAAPLSGTGELLVEGVLVSSYALGSRSQLALWRRSPGWLRRHLQGIFHTFALPLRWAPRLGWPLPLDGALGLLSGCADRVQAALALGSWIAASA